jgi:IclR family transcriptional regulator, KDG regulon repressor
MAVRRQGTRAAHDRDGRDYTLSSVRNAARLLGAFREHEPEIGLSELARRLGLGKSTVHRLLSTLSEEGLIERNPETGRYRLGLRVLELAAAVSTHMDLHQAATQHMEALRNLTGETVHIAVLDRDAFEVVYVERRESPNMLRLFGRVGHRNRAHRTSTGKALLAHLPVAELDELLRRHDLDPRTPYTITDPDVLRGELAKVRDQGYAENINESELGVASVGAPIRNAAGEVIAAISVAGPVMRFEGESMRRFAAATVQAAGGISERHGYREPPSAAGGDA